MFPEVTISTENNQCRPELTLDDLAPFTKVPQQRLLRLTLVRAFLHFGDIQRPVDSVEGSYTAHIISIVGMLFSPKAVSRVIRQMV